MGKFRHTLRRWRSAILSGEGRTELVSWLPPLVPTNELVNETRNSYLEPLLDLGNIVVTGTWMDLPQEIVNHVMFMLTNDLKSLKACSLTCKTLFVSARPFIHRKIRLTSDQNWEVLTLREKQRYIRGDRLGIAIKVLSGLAAHGLLPYGRQLFINLNKNFAPDHLRPFNDHFQRFNHIQELSIYWLHTQDFLEQFDTFFANFVPTVRSLHLNTPTGDTRDILDFVCRFPHLDDLSFVMTSGDSHDRATWKSPSIPVVRKAPPLRGRLKFGVPYEWQYPILQQLISLPGKRRFRFIEFQGCPPDVGQPMIDACSCTIETLSTVWKGSRDKGSPLDLVDVQNLRSFTLRVTFADIREPYQSLSRTLHTITSPFFSEFVLEVENIYYWPWDSDVTWRWGSWAELDSMFEGLDIERGFRVVIRAVRVDKESTFFAQVRGRFPLMDARKKLILELEPFPGK